eukprot:m.141614 g.141614  ORF g.141614 m.141614 type:complete len:226 (+) comp24154_c0_seq3:121-798(+)
MKEATKVPTDIQRLIRTGRVLEDEKTLESYGMQAATTIHLLIAQDFNSDFDDEKWTVPGLTMTDEEHQSFLLLLKQTAKTAKLEPLQVASLLLQTEKLLTPKQARAVGVILKAECGTGRDPFNFVFCSQLPASFISDIARWTSIGYSLKNEFWDDCNDACSWANATFKADPNKKTYREALETKGDAPIQVMKLNWYKSYDSSWIQMAKAEKMFSVTLTKKATKKS